MCTTTVQSDTDDTVNKKTPYLYIKTPILFL